MDGSQQLHGRDFWETYVLVTSWPTIRLILLLANILNLKRCQVNYTQAFPQAPLQDPVFMRIPQGWYADSTGTLILILTQNIMTEIITSNLRRTCTAASRLPGTGLNILNQVSSLMVFVNHPSIPAYTFETIA